MAGGPIRPLYDAYGAEGYYRDHAGNYTNPHFPQIEALLKRNIQRLDLSGKVLDFAAGGGEVSAVLRSQGAAQLIGCDPFTYELFEKQTGLDCQRLSFKDVIRTGLPDRYSLVVCSFAMHLCPQKDLFPLVWNIFQAAPALAIITPHKRPELEKLPGIELIWEDTAVTERGKKVRMKMYRPVE